jgi:hypothetical protein
MTVQPEADQPKAETGADQRPTPHEKKTGARYRKITDCARREKGKEENSFHRKGLCFLICLLMGDIGAALLLCLLL